MRLMKRYIKYGCYILFCCVAFYCLIVGIDFFNVVVRRKKPLFAKYMGHSYCSTTVDVTHCQDKFVGIGYRIYISVLDENGNIITDACPSLRLYKYKTCTRFYFLNKSVYRDEC